MEQNHPNYRQCGRGKGRSSLLKNEYIFFLGPWLLGCQFLGISNQMEVNDEVSNFFFPNCTYIKRSPVVYVYVSISSYTTRAYDNNNNLTFDERIEYVQEHVYVFIIPFTWGEFICILPYHKAIS